MNRAAELVDSRIRVTADGMRVRRTRRRKTTNTISLRNHGWIYCTAIEPTSDEEWRDLKAMMPSEYDHASYIYRPRAFALALGSMLADQFGIRGGEVQVDARIADLHASSRRGSQTIFHGPVVYEQDRFARFTSPRNEFEAFLGKIFIKDKVPLRDRCSFGRFPWLISQALSVTYMAVERRLYLERNCRLPESPAHSRRRNREGPASSQGLNSQRGFGPAVEPRRKSRPRSTSLHGSSPCKCQRLSTLRWDRLPPSRPSTKSGARAGGRRLSDRRLHRWLAGTSASAPSSHGAADLLGLNRAHICVRNQG